MLTIAGGIVIAFFVIRFLLNWQHNAQAEQVMAAEARFQAGSAERERLRLLGIRLMETNPTLWAEANARVPEEYGAIDPNKQVLARDEAGNVVAVWPSELRDRPHLKRIPIAKSISSIAKEAECICRERGLPPP